jgi:DNA-nicking Smr family endonuclease
MTEALADLFPNLNERSLKKALESASGDLDLAVAILLSASTDETLNLADSAPSCPPATDHAQRQSRPKASGAWSTGPPNTTIHLKYVKHSSLKKHHQHRHHDLSIQFPWADSELLQSILLACNNDPDAAAFILASMSVEGDGGADDLEGEFQPVLEKSKWRSKRGTAGSSSNNNSVNDNVNDDNDDDAQWQQQLSTQDAYYECRKEANKLARQWQQLVRKASVAYRNKQGGAATVYSEDAAKLRTAALEAHKQAAEEIERIVNKDNSILELDLHGLHANEAVSAVARRLEVLLQGGSGGTSVISKNGRNSVVLRLVTGKGLHSSEGEASVPRVVKNYLTRTERKFVERGGWIDVSISASKE